MKKHLVIGLAAFLLAGCTSASTRDDETLTSLQGETEALQNEVNACNLKLENLGQNPMGKGKCQDLFPVYGMDQTAENEEINFYIDVPAVLTVEEKLDRLAQGLSRFKFSGLPIQVKSVEEQAGELVATINLQEFPDSEQVSWMGTYFQGSAGGQATFLTLTQTFLQEGYEGDWIDGVAFNYQDVPFVELDHLNLSGVFYRGE